jgi:hypothetical protein
MRRRTQLLALGFLCVAACGGWQPRADVPRPKPELEANTFSIVGCDPEKKEWGCAVASKVLAVGAVVPWVQANVGAIATQASTNWDFGPRGLALLAKGMSPDEALKTFKDTDPRSLPPPHQLGTLAA